MRQGTRLSILVRLVLWAAERARLWCVTIAGIAQIASFRLIRFTSNSGVALYHCRLLVRRRRELARSSKISLGGLAR